MVWPFARKEEQRGLKATADSIQWTHVIVVAAGTWLLTKLHGKYLTRLAGATQVPPSYFRKRSLFGRVTSVGDGDNFHLYHTPGGRLTGWGWLRRVPKIKAELRGQTIPVRIAGIDAPEGAHFGRPAQPFSSEALKWLQNYIVGKRLRAYIWKRDQYDRIVATVYVRKGLFRRDVGLEMLKLGLATTYEAKTGAEFGGKKMEQVYRTAEARAKAAKLGIWARKVGFESPREYKTRIRALEEASNTFKNSSG